MGKSTISMVILNSYVSHYQRVCRADYRPAALQVAWIDAGTRRRTAQRTPPTPLVPPLTPGQAGIWALTRQSKHMEAMAHYLPTRNGDFHSYVSLPEGKTGRDTLGETWLLRCQHLLIVQQTNEGILRYVTTNIWDFTDPASKEDLLNQPANMMDFCLWMEILPTTMILYSIQSATMVISPAKREWHKHTFWQHHQQVAIGTCIYTYIYVYIHTHTHTLP